MLCSFLLGSILSTQRCHKARIGRLRSSGGGSGGQAAKDALGNDVKTASWLATHQKGDRSLTQGLKVSMGFIIDLFMSFC